MKIEPGIWYVVQETTPDNVLVKGDRVKLLEDGSLLSKKERGWLDSTYAKDILPMLKVEIDKDWANTRIKSLYGEIGKLSTYYGVKIPHEVRL